MFPYSGIDDDSDFTEIRYRSARVGNGAQQFLRYWMFEFAVPDIELNPHRTAGTADCREQHLLIARKSRGKEKSVAICFFDFPPDTIRSEEDPFAGAVDGGPEDNIGTGLVPLVDIAIIAETTLIICIDYTELFGRTFQWERL